MRFFIVVFILISLIHISIPRASASWEGILAPPSLGVVMKENEKHMKLLEKKKKTQKTQTGGVVQSLTYKTLITGKTVTLSSYDTVDLWVQEVRLNEGARIESILTQSGYDTISQEPLFTKKKPSEAIISLRRSPFSLINGQFFDPRRESTPLSFGLKVDGVVRTAGADNRNESKNILILEDNRARIVPYTWQALRDAPGYFAMVNLTLDKPQHRDEAIGRTYICLKTPTIENTSNTLLIFTALAMSEASLEGELPRWGCTRSGTTKLDASGSTRLWVRSSNCEEGSNPSSCSGEYIFGKSHKGDPDYRRIPHYLAVWDK